MTELKPHIYEQLRSREISNIRKKEMGEVAVGTIVESNEKIRKAQRLQKLGRHITAAGDLHDHRKAVQEKKITGLEKAHETRAKTLAGAKFEMKYAKKGEKSYSRSMRKTHLNREIHNQRLQRQAETGDFSLHRPKGIGERLEQRHIDKELKERAKEAIRARERGAAENIDETKQRLELARARNAQTRNALLKAKLHIGGTNSNRISSFNDAPKSQEDRLADLKSRDRMNAYFGVNELGTRVADANESIKQFEEARSIPFEAAPPAPDMPMIELVNGELPHNTVVELHPSRVSPAEADDTAKAA